MPNSVITSERGLSEGQQTFEKPGSIIYKNKNHIRMPSN